MREGEGKREEERGDVERIESERGRRGERGRREMGGREGESEGERGEERGGERGRERRKEGDEVERVRS